ncbi:type IV secretion protein Rhs, partial [Bacillus cereus]
VFLSIDPEPGDEDDPVTQNGYTYVDNNPVMLIDPDGNIPVAPLVVAGARMAAPHVARYAAKKLGTIYRDMLEVEVLKRKY